MNYNIYRTHLSGYWPKNFLDLENAELKCLPKVTYHGLVPDATKWKSPSIILSNTHFYPEKVDSIHWEKVKLILHANSGYDTLLHPQFLNNYKQPIIIAPELTAHAVAEYNLQAWLMGLGTIPFVKTWDHERTFKRRLAKDEHVLIIGHGHVGSLTKNKILAFQSHLDIYDPYVDNIKENVTTINWEKYSTIIFCCSLTSTSKNLLTKDIWKKLHPELILINSARGQLFDFELAKNFAKSNPKAKIFLDVYTQEPFSPLLESLPNIFCSSHIAGVFDNLLSQTHQWHKKVIENFCTLSETDFQHNYQQSNLQNRRLNL